MINRFFVIDSKQNIFKTHAPEVEFYKFKEENGLKIKSPKLYFGLHYGENGEQGVLILEDFRDSAMIKELADGLSIDAVKQVPIL